MSFKHENSRENDLKEPKPTILYASKDARNFIQNLGFETEHVFETIKTLALKKGAVKISVNLFKDCDKDDRNPQSALKINVCFFELSVFEELDVATELNEMLAREFPNLPAFFTINCRHA
ncbi:hypothetical protein B9Q01_06135 [Candidatus Marsarchaeota G1 archaeon OSP_D]|uniref:Uncharacterized protein n=2 Tax=Candidatus Marsarchaeota group 1 TaxID=2203770 RepID=A0A2R6A9J0_9ARCH|nr:MAG: hypothetical protein B9Q01_06135 [Candidatus Marsarchaeota G1 archaeon OSP_D]PSN88087.1 MAG: hypothetical protein B9Q00_06795 [Candidatus Marsarchaeota G1 archaeon OSP_C]